MLSVGVDWAEDFHLVALGTPNAGVVEVLRVEHRPEAMAQLLAQIAALEPDPAEVRVVIETRWGLLVEAFWDAGFTVLPVNPELIARRRGPARRTMPRMPASPVWLASTPSPSSSRSSPTASRPASCAPSPATMSRPPRTSAACSTGCAWTCSAPTQPRSRSPATSWGRPPCCACWSAGRPRNNWPVRRARSWSRSLAPPTTARALRRPGCGRPRPPPLPGPAGPGPGQGPKHPPGRPSAPAHHRAAHALGATHGGAAAGRTQPSTGGADPWR
jgi:hypothetical protein